MSWVAAVVMFFAVVFVDDVADLFEVHFPDGMWLLLVGAAAVSLAWFAV